MKSSAIISYPSYYLCLPPVICVFASHRLVLPNNRFPYTTSHSDSQHPDFTYSFQFSACSHSSYQDSFIIYFSFFDFESPINPLVVLLLS